MNSYFEVGIRYDKMMEDGTERKVTELYLMEALSFTDAEARATKEMEAYVSGEYQVITEKIVKVEEVIAEPGCGDRYYKVKYNLITLDEKSGKEKKQPQYVIIQATSVDDARDRYQNYIKGWMVDTELEAVAETKYIDYFPYSEQPSETK